MHFTSVSEARSTLREIWRSGESIGTIHTLGALHEGHARLIDRSANENKHTIVTVYPNKIQLFPGSKYVYNLDDDVALAKSRGATMVISTTDEEMYPDGYLTFVDQGVAHQQLNSSVFDFATRGQVTGAIRWISLTRPTRTYFGMKDIEQALMVDRAVRELLIDCEVVHFPCIRFRGSRAPISSRLQGLPASTVREVGLAYDALELGRRLIVEGQRNAREVVTRMRTFLDTQLATFRVLYVTAVNTTNFLPIERLEIPFILHCAISNGKINHFDGLCLRNEEELVSSPEVVWIDDNVISAKDI